MATTGAAVEAGMWHKVKAGATGPLIMLYNLSLFVLVRRAPAFVSSDDFPFADHLARNWKTVRLELDDLLEHGPAVPPFVLVEPAQKKTWTRIGRVVRRVAPSVDPDKVELDRWRTFIFRMYGLDVEPNRALCPKTAALLDEVPGVVGAMFSILDPDIRLPSHFGLFTGALRMHIGIRIPPGGQTGIRVGGHEREWIEGEAFVFEHSRWHTAWNYSDEPRVVLILDFERPMPWRWLERVNHRVVTTLAASGRTAAFVQHIERLNDKPAGAPS